MNTFTQLLERDPDIVTMARNACGRYAAQTAFSCMGTKLSFSKLDQLSDFVAAWFQQQPGLLVGDRVAIQLPNILQYPVIALGALKAGLVIVNTNPLYSTAELKHHLNDSEARFLVVLANTAVNAASIIEDTRVEQVIVTQVGDLMGPVKGAAVNFVLKHVRKQVPECKFPNMIAFSKLLSRAKATAGRKGPGSVDTDSNSLAVLQYTGGTTGISKAAMLSHANLLANTFQVTEKLGEECPAAGSVLVAPLPLYHVYAFTMNFLCGLYNGHHNILIPNPRDIKGLVKAISAYRINGFVGINTLYEKLLDDEQFCKQDFSALSLCSSGGMALTEEVHQRWHDITGCRILEGYGLTESSPLLSCNTLHEFRAGTVGKAIPWTEIKIVDINRNDLQAGLIGEICARGPQVMSGYWQQEEETTAVLDEDGWLYTGDIGVMDEEGWLRIVDRIKDMIIVSGFNVFPNEIEKHVCSHPLITEAAAIGIPEGIGVQSGSVTEIIKLYVVCDDQSLTVEEIVTHCRTGLAPYKIPKIIEFRESLPKSNIGKILRRQLREQG